MHILTILGLIFDVLLLAYGALSFIGILPGNKIASIGFALVGLGEILTHAIIYFFDYFIAAGLQMPNTWTTHHAIISSLAPLGFLVILFAFFKSKVIPGNLFAIGGAVLYVALFVLRIFALRWLSAHASDPSSYSIIYSVISVIIPIFFYLSFILLMFASYTEGQKDKG